MLMILTAHQIKLAYEAMGGDPDPGTEFTIEFLSEKSLNTEDGTEPAPAGVYLWLTEYPEEGAVHLPATPEEQP